MSKQQTVVDWLISQIAEQPDPKVEYYTCNGKNITKEVLEAKKLHRQQIIEAHGIKQTHGYKQGVSFWEATTGEQYYNDKYGSDGK